MWIAKLKWKHNCMIGNRCNKFNVTAVGVPLDMFKEGGITYYSHFNILLGKDEDIKSFVKDLKKDKHTKSVEFEGNTIFFLVSLPDKEKIPTTHYNRKIFFLKPVKVDNKGYEHWEIASWEKQYLNDFISSTKKETEGMEDFKLLSIEKTKLNEIYFPQIMPLLTKEQREAISIAYENNYYDFPRKIELKELAKKSNKSLSTYREHLRKAEKKLMPDLIKNINE